MGKSNLLTDIIKKNGTLYATLSAIGGFIGDVLQPLAPLSEYIFYIFSAVSLLLLLTYFIIGGTRERIASFLILSITILIVSGGIFGLQSVTKSENGILSDTVPAIESFQSSLGILEKGIADIRKDTTEIKKSNKEISTKIDLLGEKIGKQGGIISNPNTPEEYYSNARHYELKGDYGNARRSYLKYFKLEDKYLDPHIRFQLFLKIQEGRIGAKEIYNEMFEFNKNIVINYAKILLENNKNKRKNIEIFVENNPNFAPAYYELAYLYSKAVLGEQTLNDKKMEVKYLKVFQDLYEKGKLTKYYIDKKYLNDMIEKANNRLMNLKKITDKLLKNPLSFQAMRHNGGWNINISAAEKVQEFFYKLENDNNYTSLGASSYYIDTSTMKPLGNNIMELPKDTPSQVIKIKYFNLNGIINGPYDYHFNPLEELQKGAINNLKMTSTNWISFRYFNGKLLVYFSHLSSYACGISTIKYGIDKKIPDTLYPVQTCNPMDPYMSSGGYITVPKKTKYITIEIEYKNGETSKMYTFNNHAPQAD